MWTLTYQLCQLILGLINFLVIVNKVEFLLLRLSVKNEISLFNENLEAIVMATRYVTAFIGSERSCVAFAS